MTVQNREVLVSQLAGVLGQLGSKELLRLERLLIEGSGGTMYGFLNLPRMTSEEAQELMVDAGTEMEHDENVTAHRKRLHECIDDAQKRIQWALGEIGTLDELGDAEYMGGHADLEAFLADAARNLRAAQKIKPTDKDGNA